jgi:uncharacterized paraquat-inducible protein A
MRALTKYFWRVFYRLRPVTSRTSKTAYVRAACRMQGIKVVTHPMVHATAVDYRGLGWTGVRESKICCEASCNQVYVPDSTGKCPRCGSQGMWISRTMLGNGGGER